jgi:eukaryotic-like serine/threonine-protein kinase
MSLSVSWTADLTAESEAIVRKFESAWRKPGRPDILHYLPTPRAGRTSVLYELVHVDLDLRLRNGESARVEDYLDRFPDLVHDRSAVVDLIAAEYALRRQWRGHAAPDEYLRRFPEYGDELQARLAAEPAASGPPRALVVPVGNPIDPPGYQLGAELGRGGMGVVYRAYQPALNRSVAVKTLVPGYATAEELDRFRREAEAIARLDHPNIVPVYEVGEHAGLPYYSMKLYPGGSLAGRVRGPSPDPRADALLAETIARAVHHAHQRGVLHRDLKPSNILLDDAGQPHIADFGLAKWFDPIVGASLESQVVGTPGYLAPEQARGNELVTTATDVYGVGALLYELLTGGPPFLGATPLATLAQVVRDAPRPPRQVNPSVAPDLELICLKCLEKDPARRYPSAEALADDLERLRHGEPISARPVGRLEGGRLWVRRNPVLAAIGGTAILSLLVGSIAVGFFAARAHRDRTDALAAADRADRKSDEATASARAARRSLYLAEIQLAERAWRQGLFGQLHELLDRQIPGPGQEDLRGLEWYYLRRRSEGDRSMPHAADVTCLTVSRDGQRIATGDADGTLTVWDAATGRKLVAVKAHDGRVSAVAFNRDGSRLVTSRGHARPDSGEVKVWDAQSGGHLQTLDKDGRGVGRLAFSPKGDRLYTAGAGEVIAWDLAKGLKLRTFAGHHPLVMDLALSPDGDRLAVGGPTVTVWDTASGDVVRSLTTDKGLPQISLAWSGDGRHLATGGCCPGDFTVTIWNVATGEPTPTKIAHTAAVTGLAYRSGDQQLVSVSDDTTVRVYDVAARQPVPFAVGHAGPVAALGFDPKGRWLATAGGDRTAKVWDLTDNREAATWVAHSDSQVFGLAYSPDCSLLATCNGRAPMHGRTLEHPGQVKVWDTATRKLRFTLAGHAALVASVAFTPDGRRLATGSLDRTVRVWDMATGDLLRTIHVEFEVQSAVFSPDGKTLAVGGGPPFRAQSLGWIRLHAADTGEPIASLGSDLRAVSCLAFSPDGTRLASSSLDGSAAVWDIATGQRVVKLDAHRYGALGVAFDRTGTMLATCGRDDTTRLWDAATGQLVRKLQEHTGYAKSVAFSPDGSRVLSSGADGRGLKVWDAATGELILTLQGPDGGVTVLGVSPDGQRIAAGGQDGTVTEWVAPRE